MGQVDELNSLIGLMMTEALPTEIHQFLTVVQHTLFDLGGELSLPGHTLVSVDQVEAVENMLDELNGALAPSEFILPGGTRAAALCHVARSTTS